MIAVILPLLIVSALSVLFILLLRRQPKNDGNPAQCPVPSPHSASGRNGNFPRPAPSHPRATQPAGESPGSLRLDAEKTIRAFDFILKSFGQLPPWQSPRKWKTTSVTSP